MVVLHAVLCKALSKVVRALVTAASNLLLLWIVWVAGVIGAVVTLLVFRIPSTG
jgi:hypothetical protein